MILEFRDKGPQISSPKLKALLLEAAAELDKDEKNFGGHTASSGAEYRFGLDQGVNLWLLKVYRSPQGYLTYGQLRTMITGLQLYMILGKHPETVRFRLLVRPRSTVLGYGAVGNF